jgi:hypothetical protein
LVAPTAPFTVFGAVHATTYARQGVQGPAQAATRGKKWCRPWITPPRSVPSLGRDPGAVA